MAAPLSFEKTNEILGSIKIPAAPAVFMQLHELMQVDEPEIDKVAATIAKDVGLAALTLKTVNSPFFSLRAKVSSIRQATHLLGLLNVSNIVAGLALRRAMEEGGGPTPEHYWDSPVNIGMAAAKLAHRLADVAPDEAYMLGLFHNVGLPLMMQRFDDYLEIIRVAEEGGEDLIATEQAHFQTSHAVVGYYLARTWGLPDRISDLILRHHEVDEVLSASGDDAAHAAGLLAVLKMAEHIDNRFWGRLEDPEWARHAATVLGFVGISAPDFEDIVEDTVDLLAQD